MQRFPSTQVAPIFSFDDEDVGGLPLIPAAGATHIQQPRSAPTAQTPVDSKGARRSEVLRNRSIITPATVVEESGGLRLGEVGISTAMMGDLDVHEDSSEDDGREPTLRADGSRRAKGRPITKELSLTDRIIVSLKDKGHTNEFVVQELQDKGLEAYDAKTIGSRYVRLKAKQAEKQDALLEDGVISWEAGADEMLLKAVAIADKETEEAIDRAKKRRWESASKHLKQMLNKNAFTAKACKDRFIAIMDDAPEIPIELDDDPEARQRERASRVLASVQARERAEEMAKIKAEEKRLAADLRASRAAANKFSKTEARFEAAKRKFEEAKKLQEMQDEQRKAMEAAQAKGIGRISKVAKKFAMKEAAAAAAATSSDGGSDPVPKKRKVLSLEAAASPRAHMSVKELGDLLMKRGLTKKGSKKDMIARLSTSDQQLTPADLQKYLHQAGVSQKGTREEQVTRLVQAEVRDSRWGQKHGAGVASSAVARTEGPNDDSLSHRRDSVAIDEEAGGAGNERWEEVNEDDWTQVLVLT